MTRMRSAGRAGGSGANGQAWIRFVSAWMVCAATGREYVCHGDQTDARRPNEKGTELYVRGLNGTKALDEVEKQKYIAQRWPGTPDIA